MSSVFRNLPAVSATSALGKALAATDVAHTEYVAEGAGSSGGGVRIRVVACGPSQKHSEPRKATEPGKKDFLGTARQPVLMVGTPCGPVPNRMGGSGAHKDRSGHWAWMPASHLGFDDGMPDDAPRGKEAKRTLIQGDDDRFYLFEGAAFTIEKFGGTVLRSTHHRASGSKVQDGETGDELPAGWVAEVVIDQPTINGQSTVVKCKYMRVLGNGSDPEHANDVLYAWTAAAQNAIGPYGAKVLPFHPPVPNPNVDWAKVKVPKRDGSGTDENSSSIAGPTNDKLRVMKADGLDHDSREASFRTLTQTSVNMPDRLQCIRDGRADWVPVMSGNMLTNLMDVRQFIKGTDAAPAATLATKPMPPLSFHTESLSLMVVPGRQTPVEVRVPTTIPHQLVRFFGLSDPDLQIHARMFLHNGVYNIRSSPMTNSFFPGGWKGENFKISAYPSMVYLGKTAQWDTAQIHVDWLFTVLNTTLPVSRAAAMMAMIGLNKSPRTKNANRFMVQMSKVHTDGHYKDSAGNPIPANVLERNTNEANEERVVMLAECRRDIASAYPNHVFRVLIDGLTKDDESVQQLFASVTAAATEAGSDPAIALIKAFDDHVATLVAAHNNLTVAQLNTYMAAGIARVREECARHELWIDPSAPVPPQAQPGFFWPDDPGMEKPTAEQAEEYVAPARAKLQKLYGEMTIFEEVPREQMCAAFERLMPEPPANAPNDRPAGKYVDAMPFLGTVLPMAIDANYAAQRGVTDLLSPSVDMHRAAFAAVETAQAELPGIMSPEAFEAYMQELEDAAMEKAVIAAEAKAAATAASAMQTDPPAAAASSTPTKATKRSADDALDGQQEEGDAARQRSDEEASQV